MFNLIEKKSMKKLVFLMMLFGLMIVVTGSASAQQNCGDPKDDEVIIYEHIFSQDGGGKCKVLKAGEYKNAAAKGLANNTMSSIKVGKNVYVEVCDLDDFKGACEIFDKNDDDFRNNPLIKNDIVSSIKVVKAKNEGAKVCSPQTNEKVNIKWTNQTGKPIRINWINFDCAEESSDRLIQPGGVFDGYSFVGHVFHVRDGKTKESLGKILVTSTNGTQNVK